MLRYFWLMAPVNVLPKFPATRWSVVLQAAGDGTPSRVALEELCRLYWLPLYAFARQKGCSPEDAEDHTQEFLARVASGGILSQAHAGRGHLRTYLLAAFQNDLTDAARREATIKRGGRVKFIPFDLARAESLTAPSGSETPGAAYDRLFALASLEQAMRLLAAEYEARGNRDLFSHLRPFLDPGAESNHAAAAAAVGLDGNALRQAIFRLRQRFRSLLRQVVADTLNDPSEELIEDELNALRRALT